MLWRLAAGLQKIAPDLSVKHLVRGYFALVRKGGLELPCSEFDDERRLEKQAEQRCARGCRNEHRQERHSEIQQDGGHP